MVVGEGLWRGPGVKRFMGRLRVEWMKEVRALK
jgi:hypothetical protein